MLAADPTSSAGEKFQGLVADFTSDQQDWGCLMSILPLRMGVNGATASASDRAINPLVQATAAVRWLPTLAATAMRGNVHECRHEFWTK